LAAFGHNRDGKKGKLQMCVAMLTKKTLKETLKTSFSGFSRKMLNNQKYR